MLWWKKDWAARTRQHYGSQFSAPLNLILSYKKQWKVCGYLKARGWHHKTEKEVDNHCCLWRLLFLLALLILGSRDGVVVITLTSHLHGLGSGHEWVKLVVSSLLCSKKFFSGFSGFPLSSKESIFPNSNLIGCRTSLKTTLGWVELPG